MEPNLIMNLPEVPPPVDYNDPEIKCLKEAGVSEVAIQEHWYSKIKNNPPVKKKKRHYHPILESEIIDAQKNCRSAAACARYLKVSYRTFRKWAKIYGLFKTNPWKKGSKKDFHDPTKGKYPINDILQGKHPNYPIYRLKDLLIRSQIKEAHCEQCGFRERRITDGKIPLILNFEDGNTKNHSLENLKIFCYNCTFTSGRGFISRPKVRDHFLDADKLQGSYRKTDVRF